MVVTGHKMPELAQLETQIAALVARRRAAIAAAEAMIARANRDFDMEAIPLMREANKLRPVEEPITPLTTPAKRARKNGYSNKKHDLTGLSPEEQQHYHELQQRKGRQ